MPRNTYAGSTPCPCDDCENHDYCKVHRKSCKVSRYWETNGSVMSKPRRAGKERVPADRVPDMDL